MGVGAKHYVKLTPEEQQLVQENMGLARAAARFVYGHYQSVIDKVPMTWDDFVSVSYLCLCVAVKNYDKTKGKVSSYLIGAIRRGMMQYIARRSSLFKLPSNIRDKKFYMVEGGDTVSFDQPCYEGKDGDSLTYESMLASPDTSMNMLELMHSINQVLDDREKYVLLGIVLGGCSQASLAKELGVSQMSVSRTLKRATEKLRKSLAA